MKKFSAGILFIFLISCSADKIEKAKEELTNPVPFDTLAIGNKIYQSQNIADSDYVFENFELDGSDSLTILKYTNEGVSREKDTLILKCDNGTIRKFKNTRSDGDDVEFYNFMYYNKDINAYVLNRSLYEGSDTWLINKQSGDSLIVIGYPIVSPDKKKFICANVDLEAMYSANGIALYKNEKNKYISLGFRELTNWGPERVMWKNDTTAIIRALKRQNNGQTTTFHKALYIK